MTVFELIEWAARTECSDVHLSEGLPATVRRHRKLAAADAFVAPSLDQPSGRTEGMPTALLEAARGQVTAGLMMRVLRDHGPSSGPPRPDRGLIGTTVCAHPAFGPAAHGAGEVVTS